MESTLPRRERERLIRRQAMLEAARAVFAEKGFANATIEEVAHRAEFGKGTVYNYFENKEQLLLAILDDMFDEMVSLVESSFASSFAAPALDREAFRVTFRGFLQRFLDHFRERQDLFVILMKEAQTMLFSDELEKAAYLMRQSNRAVGALVAPIERAIEAGYLKPLPAEMIAHTIFGNLKGFQMHICIATRHGLDCSGDMPTSREAAEFLTTMLLDGLMVPSEQPSYN